MKNIGEMFLLMAIFLGIFFMIHKRSKFLIFGHRGACGYEPENTISSFKKALEIGVDGIELDVHVCATGELVVIHDDTVDRTTNDHGYVADMSFKQLAELLVERNERISTLAEIINFIDRRVPINIELKGSGAARPVADLLHLYFKRGWSYDNFIVSSFNFAELEVFKQFCSMVKTGALFEKDDQNNDKIGILAKGCGANFIGIEVAMVTKKLVDSLHKEGFLVFAWTINDKKTAEEMRKLRLDGIFSNCPDKVV